MLSLRLTTSRPPTSIEQHAVLVVVRQRHDFDPIGQWAPLVVLQDSDVEATCPQVGGDPPTDMIGEEYRGCSLNCDKEPGLQVVRMPV